MNKYGSENFSIEQIEECDSEIVNDRETYWIEYYGSFKNGYNATKGGDGKSYLDYDLVITTYNHFQSEIETAKNLNISVDSVRKILKEKNISIKPSSEIIKEKYGKITNMYSLDNVFLRSFSSTNEAAQYMVDNNLTGCKKTTIKQHITEVCNGKRKTAAKYKWSYN